MLCLDDRPFLTGSRAEEKTSLYAYPSETVGTVNLSTTRAGVDDESEVEFHEKGCTQGKVLNGPEEGQSTSLWSWEVWEIMKGRGPQDLK